MCVVVTLHHFHSGKRGPFLNDVMPIRSFTVKALMKDPLSTLTIRIPATFSCCVWKLYFFLNLPCPKITFTFVLSNNSFEIGLDGWQNPAILSKTIWNPNKMTAGLFGFWIVRFWNGRNHSYSHARPFWSHFDNTIDWVYNHMYWISGYLVIQCFWKPEMN